MDGRAKNGQAVDASEQRLASTFRVRHHADHIAPGVGDAGDVALRPVGVRLRRHPAVGCAVAEEDLAVALERIEGIWIGEEVALAV